ncbi:MAG: AMP-binding protein [Burkholderiales bacterium]|nr:AMP-binding protein [Burkholderiales bacterium]
MLPRDMLARCAGHFPDKPAYHCGERTRSWREMHARSSAFACALQSLGVHPGETVSVLGRESLEIYEHFFACMKAGAVRVGINWRYTPAEVLHVLRDSATRMLLVHSACLELLPPRAELEALGIRLIGYGGAHGLALDYESLLAQAGAATPDLPPISGDDVLLVSYTSGTTGHPKGAMLTHAGVAASILRSLINAGFSPDDVWYMPLSAAWVPVVMGVFGLGNGMTTVIADGAFDAAAFLRDIGRLRVSFVNVVSAMLQRIVQEGRSGRYDLSSMRVLTYGSSPAPAPLIREAWEMFGCEVKQPYAMTENAGCWITCLQHSDVLRAFQSEPGLLGSAGRVGVMCEISIRDGEGHAVAAGSAGEVWIRSATVMKGYRNLPGPTAEALRDGWLCTNDIGRLDERGYLYLTDRKKFMIISGGVNVFPAAVEAVAIEHPALEEVAVVGAPHPQWGEAVVAVATLRHGAPRPEASELLAFCRERLGKTVAPKHFLFRDELPRPSTGKLQKHLIRDWVRDNAHLLPWNRSDAGRP